MIAIHFEWDEQKELLNRNKHNVSFHEARKAFQDPKRVIAQDVTHSQNERRMYCIGKVQEKIITVRYTYRNNNIRIFGAGYWRQGKKLYEKENS